MLLEGTLVRATLRGVLAVDEAVVLLTILIGVGKGYLDILALQVDDGVERVVGHAILQQILQTMTAQYTPAVIHNGQSRIQIGVVAEHVLHNVVVELVTLEEFVISVRLEIDVCAVLVFRLFRNIVDELSLLESGFSHDSIAKGVHLKMRTQRINGLHAHTIQSDGFLESLRIVLTTRIQHADSLNHLALRNASAIVSDRDAEVVFDIDFYAVASLHLELVDGVVDDLLQQHIDAILGKRAVAQSSDIHARTQANVLSACQGFDVVVVVIDVFLL